MCQAATPLVVATDGWQGLLLRGLTTRLLTNALQASVFTIVWKLVEERLTAARAPPAADAAAGEAPPEEPEPVAASVTETTLPIEDTDASVPDEAENDDADEESN